VSGLASPRLPVTVGDGCGGGGVGHQGNGVLRNDFTATGAASIPAQRAAGVLPVLALSQPAHLIQAQPNGLGAQLPLAPAQDVPAQNPVLPVDQQLGLPAANVYKGPLRPSWGPSGP